MGYVLEALLAPLTIAESAAGSLPGAGVVRLREGIALVPITGDAAEALSPGDRSIVSLLANHPLPAALTDLLRRTSQQGPIAYLEADIFGGTGQQASVLWERGELALGPLVDPEPESLVVRGDRPEWPFNQVLRRMGVAVAPGQPDEFATVGLGRHRETEDWLVDADLADPRSA
jgi:hypothetical protein